MEQIINRIHNFTFDIEFNDPNITKLNLNKKLKPILIELLYINKLIEEDNNILIDDIEKYNINQKNIINKIAEKIKIEHSDEVDLINIYTNKLNKHINKFLQTNDTNQNPLELIQNIITTPLEGEMAKHNKIKIITCKIVKKDNNLDVIFYIKYKECDGYNKQFKKLIQNSYQTIMSTE